MPSVIDWLLLPELLSLILILMIILFFWEKWRRDGVSTRGRQLFWLCLFLSLLSIVLDMVCVYTIQQAQWIPRWVNLLLNSIYFMTSLLMSTAIAFYLRHRVLEYKGWDGSLCWVGVALGGAAAVYGALVVWNWFSGIIFYFDQAGIYHRGPLNQIGYLALAIQLAVIMVCYWRNRRCVDRAMVRVIWAVPCVVVPLGAYQMLYPDHLLNGTIAGLVDLAIFLSFQNRSIEQDSLTGAGNRKSFFGELSLRMAGGQRFQVILVGLEQFGRINRQFGHWQGDSLLCQVARRLDRLPGGGRPFRFGNVEFALIRPLRVQGGEEAYLEQVCALFREEWTLDKVRCRVPVRAAELVYQGQDWTPELVIEYLEYTLHLAKKSQTERVRFSGQVAQGYQRQSHLIQTMQQAVAQGGFQVWYQPIYSRELGRFASAEALLRLTDDQGRWVPPDEFIPLAERTGLMDALSRTVLEETCRLLGQSGAPGLEHVTVNLSGEQLRPDLPRCLSQFLHRYGVQPRRLKLEITERQLLEDTGYVRELMEQLAGEKLRFYLDDFGTGYSNLSCALDLPFEGIKLDRSLMSGVTDDPRRRQMAQTLIPLFHSLGLTVVAEGIEAEDQARQVLAWGADCIQGFYYARPMPGEELAALFRRQARERAPL